MLPPYPFRLDSARARKKKVAAASFSWYHERGWYTGRAGRRGRGRVKTIFDKVLLMSGGTFLNKLPHLESRVRITGRVIVLNNVPDVRCGKLKTRTRVSSRGCSNLFSASVTESSSRRRAFYRSKACKVVLLGFDVRCQLQT